MELRCDSKLHAIYAYSEAWIEIKCDSRFCGHRKGVVVLHRFDLFTGKMTTTKRFKEPLGGSENGASNDSASLRSA